MHLQRRGAWRHGVHVKEREKHSIELLSSVACQSIMIQITMIHSLGSQGRQYGLWNGRLNDSS